MHRTLLALVVVVTLAHAAAALAASPLRIAYSGSGSRAFGACTMNPDGTDNVCVANGYRPAPTPDGSALYFTDMKDDTTTNYRAIYKVDADGTNLRLIHFRAFDFGPQAVDVSPDGTHVVYDRYEGNSLFAVTHVYIADADGANERQLTFDASAEPSFSPDGAQVVFFACPTAPINDYGHICTVPAAGGAPKVIATNGEDPRWGRNGQIAYRDLTSGHIILVDGNGQNRVDTGIVGAQPALSPDGRRVLFTRMPPLSNVWRIWIANVDGSNQRELTVGERPNWFQSGVPAAVAPPTVTVTSPASGQIVGGRPVTFTWNATGDIASAGVVLENVDPTLLNGSPDEPQNPDVSSLGFTIAKLPGSARSFTWTPPASMNWTDRIVRIAVTDTQGQIAVATAGPVTTRPAPEIPPYVRVAYPSEPVDITWYAGGSGFASFRDDDPDGISRLEARLSLDGGATFPIVLATGDAWTTILSFTVPNVTSTAARVKVTAWDALGNASSDVSDTNFTVIGPSVPPSAAAAAVSSLALSPASVSGGATSQATVTLSAPAPSGGAAVSLTSNSAAATLPVSVTVPAGATAATFTVATKSVGTSTSATITASYAGTSQSSSLTIAAPAVADTVAVTRAEYGASQKQLRFEATSSSASGTLTAHVTSSGQLIGTLANAGGGTYKAQFSWPSNPASVTVKSSLGGSAMRSVVAK